MAWFKPTSVLDKTYEIGIALKGLDGALEVLGGFLLLLIKPSTINHLVVLLTQRELAQDPHDFIATHLLHSGQHLATGGTIFAVIYLWGHGIIKLVVVIALLRNKLWAYPFSFVTLGLFVAYQTYQIARDHSIGLILLTVFDLFIIWLIWREYKQVRAKKPAPTQQQSTLTN
jgi:uncharacterized membrane protein